MIISQIGGTSKHDKINAERMRGAWVIYMVLRDNVRVFVACEEDLHPDDNDNEVKRGEKDQGQR